MVDYFRFMTWPKQLTKSRRLICIQPVQLWSHTKTLNGSTTEPAANSRTDRERFDWYVYILNYAASAIQSGSWWVVCERGAHHVQLISMQPECCTCGVTGWVNIGVLLMWSHKLGACNHKCKQHIACADGWNGVESLMCCMWCGWCGGVLITDTVSLWVPQCHIGVARYNSANVVDMRW